MPILQKLTIKNLHKNKRRTIVTILGVMLSAALILAVVGMVTSFQKMMESVAISETGNYHAVFDSVPTDSLKYITENQHVKEYFYSEPVTAESVGEDTFETYTLYPGLAYQLADYKRLDSLPEHPNKAYNIYVVYDNPKDFAAIQERILTTLKETLGKDINVRTNSNLLRAYGVVSDQALTSLYWIAGIIIAIIVITSIIVIRNSFSISATERTRQFGMLASIGATPQQIRHSVIFEGIIISAIGIPLGILLGVVAVAVLVIIINCLMQDVFMAAIEFSLPFWVFPFTLGLSFITILLSCLWPAIRASRIPAVEAIRGSQDIKIKAKKLRTSKLTANIFGVGGVIAAKNLKRSRKKYRTTVISIVLSVATFVGLSSFITYGKKTIDLEYRQTAADISISGADSDFYQKLVERFGINNYAYYLATTSANISVAAMNETAFREFANLVGIKTDDYNRIAIANNQTLEYGDDGGYRIGKLEGLQEGENFTVELLDYDCKMSKNATGKHKTCELSDDPTPIDIKISKITESQPLGLEGVMQPMIFVSEKYFQPEIIANVQANLPSSQFFAASIPNLEELDSYMNEIADTQGESEHIFYNNLKENQDQMRRVVLLMSIFLYGFVAVVTLIGVTNIFNTITTNIALRAKEFAMLKSIGMTHEEFNRMIRLESLMYAGKALLIGLPIGLLLSYGFYQSIANSVDFGFIFPYPAILISIIAVALLISVIMHYSVRQVEKQNIIETIRSENI